MNIRMFNKKYWVRRFGEPKNIRGHLGYPKEDFVASLHVHPAGRDTMQALPEGQRHLNRLEGHGEVELIPANEEGGKKGDLIHYFGRWYECVSCEFHHTTLLSHYNYQFVLVPVDAGGTADTVAPAGDPNNPPVPEAPNPPDDPVPDPSAPEGGEAP